MNILDENPTKTLKLAGGKVICNSRSLAKVLQPMLMVVNTSTVLPILEDVCIDATEHKLKLTVSDLESVWSSVMDVECRNEFTFCVNLKMLYKFCNEIPGQPIVLNYLSREGRLEITTDDMKVYMPIEYSGDFPKSPVIEKADHVWKPGYSIIIPQLANALKFVSNDDLRPSTTGVYIHDSKGSLAIAATDAHRLYWDKLLDKTPESMKGFARVLPPKACRVMCKWFRKGDDIEITANGNHIQFKQGNVTYIMRYIDARYPNYQTVMPKPETQLCFRRKDLKSLLKVAMMFSNKSTNLVSLHIRSDKAEIISEDLDFSFEFKSRVNVYDCSNKSIDFIFGANAKSLLSMLDIVKDEYVKLLTMEHADKPMIFDDCILIMPMMLNN